jgi:aminopeptidase N
VAGPYEYVECEGASPPMRIYARDSLMKWLHLRKEEMFMVTQAGIRFYEKFFGQVYPFRKYDQVFTPNHNWGAMENVGCVTYNESYLFKDQEKPLLAKRLRFSITNLHELAHMWFGNLVTMKWWNDLWLNESFATFMSFLAMSQSEELQYFDTVWCTFLGYKGWGVRTDCTTSVHPITCEINSTIEAEAMFDGISYGKGSSWLKQVYNVIGHDTMSQGLATYFKKHAWGNTILTDFIGALDGAYEQNRRADLGETFNFS